MVSELIARKKRADALPGELRERYAETYNRICYEILRAVLDRCDAIERAVAAGEVNRAIDLWEERDV